jgi:hypothetical protein
MIELLFKDVLHIKNGVVMERRMEQKNVIQMILQRKDGEIKTVVLHVL